MSDNPAQTGATTPPASGTTSVPAETSAPAPAGAPSTPTAPVVSVPASATPAPAPAAAKAPAAPKTTPIAPKMGVNQSKTAENASKTSISVSAEPKNVAIKMLRSHPAVAVFAGDTTTVSAELAAQLVAGKFAEHTTEVPAAELVKPTEAQLVQARAAYARYGAVTDFKNFQGNPMPEFDKLPEAIQCAWAAAASLEYNHKAE